MTRARKIDANQPEIVAALRAAGASVLFLHTVGNGCPDILAGYRGQNVLIEIKDHRKPRSRRVLTPDEAEFHRTWSGQVGVAETVDDALMMIGAVGVTL